VSILLSLLAAFAAVNPAPDLLTEFSQTCVPSHSLAELNQSLAKDGWKAIPNAQGKIAGVIAAVEPMLDAQGLSSNYVIYSLNSGDKNFELAVSETKKPIANGRKLIGCSIYDFSATMPIDRQRVEALAKGIAGQQSAMGDVNIEKWNNLHGPGSGMRAVFVPPNSQVKSALGFTGMMLGTHFLDGAPN
jgi:hypothetical protein